MISEPVLIVIGTLIAVAEPRLCLCSATLGVTVVSKAESGYCNWLTVAAVLG